jgi:hypothetical protein
MINTDKVNHHQMLDQATQELNKALNENIKLKEMLRIANSQIDQMIPRTREDHAGGMGATI